MTTTTRRKKSQPKTDPSLAGRGRPTVGIPAARAAKLQAQGMTYKQIATELRVSVPTAARLLRTARGETVTDLSARLEQFIAAVQSGNPEALAHLERWQPADPQSLTLDRTGQSPLRIHGSLIRQGSTRLIQAKPDKPHADWWEIKIYRLTDPAKSKYAVSITYSHEQRKVISGETWATLTSDPSKTITDYDPLETLRGFPDTPEFDTRQEFLERQSKIQYGQLVSDLLRDPL